MGHNTKIYLEAFESKYGPSKFADPKLIKSIDDFDYDINKIVQKPKEDWAKIASNRHDDMIKDIARARGKQPEEIASKSLEELVFLDPAFGQALDLCVQTQDSDPAFFERLAYDLVLSMDEFKFFAKLEADGIVKFDIRLIKPPPMRFNQPLPDEDTNIKFREPSEMVLKRKLANVMIQGSAMSKNQLFHLVANEIDSKAPGLTKAFAIVITTMDMTFWGHLARELFGGGSEVDIMGTSKLDLEDDNKDNGNENKKTYIIRAYAALFPILVHELVKGCTEFMSLGMFDDMSDFEAQEIMTQADTMPDEQLGLIIGKDLWIYLNQLIDPKYRKYIQMVFHRIMKLPTYKIRNILQSPEYGKDVVKHMVSELKTEEEELGGFWLNTPSESDIDFNDIFDDLD